MSWDGFELEKAYRTRQDEDKRIEKRQDKRWEAQEFVRALLAERAIWLIEGKSAPPDGPAVVELLLKEINAQSDAESRRLARNFLIKGIGQGVQEKRWRIPVPEQTLRTKLPKPPFTSKTFIELGKITKLRDAFYKSLKDPQFVHNQRWKSSIETKTYFGHEIDLPRGRVLLAMVIFGGIVRKSQLKAIAQQESSALCCYSNVLWMEWKKANEFDDLQESWLRWYPEQISGLLVAAAHRQGLFPLLAVSEIGDVQERAIWAQIGAILKLLKIKNANRPSSLSELMRWTRTWLQFNIPPVLAHFAGGPLNCESLSPAAHIRLITGQKEEPTVVPPSGKALVSVQDTQHGSGTGGRLASSEDLTRLRRELRAIFTSPKSKPKPKKIVLKQIDAYLQRTDLPASFVRLGQWTRNMLVDKQHGTGKLELSSISSYLLRVDKPLSVILEDRDPAVLDEAELAEVYSEIVGGLRERSIARVIIALRKFHEFLVTGFGASDEAGEVFDGYACGSLVDANVLSEANYRLAFERLSAPQTGQPLWLGKMQQVALILGYRGLLRRGEVHRLRLGDVRGNQCGVIYVRSTEAGTVKSASSNRNIVYKGNLSQDEELVFREFVDNRLRQIIGIGSDKKLDSAALAALDKKWKTPLFQEPGTENPVPIILLFKQITTVMKEVTGSEKSHFHLARKGGINWKLLVVMEEELPGCSLFLDPSGDARRTSSELHRSLMATDHGDRRKVWAMSALAGHANPVTTIGSYVTCLDWLLGYSLLSKVPLPDSIVSAVTGRSVTDIRTHRSRNNIMRTDYLSLIGEDWISKIKIKVEIKQQNSQEYCEPAFLFPELNIDSVNILRILNEAIADEREIERLAIKNQILPSTLKSWVGIVKRNDNFTSANKSNNSSGLTLPKTPQQTTEKERLNLLSERIARYAKKYRDEVLKWISLLFSNYSKRDNAVIFYDLGSAATFYKTLKDIISDPNFEIGISLAPLSKKGSSSVDLQRKSWLDALNIDSANVVIDSCIGRQPGPGVSGKLSIYLKSDKDDECENVKNNISSIIDGNISGKEWTKTRSGALAAAAYLARIGLCNPDCV